MTRSVRCVFSSVVLLAVLAGCGRGRSGDPSAHGEARATRSAATASGASASALPSATDSASATLVPASAPSVVGAAPHEVVPGAIEPTAVDAFLRRLSAFGGKGSLVNAFASWCGPCREEVPLLEAMAPHLARDGITVVFVSFDEPDDRDEAEAFLRAYGVRSPAFLALDALGFRKRMSERWPGMIPATFLFDSRQKLRYFWGGPAYEHEILPVVEGFVAGRTIDGQSSFALSPGRTE